MDATCANNVRLRELTVREGRRDDIAVLYDGTWQKRGHRVTVALALLCPLTLALV